MNSFLCSSLVKTSDVLSTVLSMLFACCAMLCKEQGITVLGVLFVYEVFVVQNNWIRKCNVPSIDKQLYLFLFKIGAVIFTCLFLMALRFQIMGQTLPVFTNFDNPASYAPAPAKQLTWAYLLPGKSDNEDYFFFKKTH